MFRKQSIIKEVIKQEERIAIADKVIKHMSQEWIDQLNEEFEQLSINDSIRMENARIKWAREEGQKELIQTLQRMSTEERNEFLKKPLEEIQDTLKTKSQ